MRAKHTSTARGVHGRRLLTVAALTLSMLATACGGDTGGAGTKSSEAITVAAASDLRPAFEEIGADFTELTGVKVTFSFGSSGQLREQILNGAPFDVYASASEQFVDEIIDAGRAAADSKQIYGYGRIVLVAADGVVLPTSIENLADDSYAKIAIANPEHAPYGTAAKQALESVGVFAAVEDRLVYGENVSDTLRLATSGNVDVAIVALSLAIAESGESAGEYTLIPDTLHEPLRQAIAATSLPDATPPPQALDFIAYVGSRSGREVMTRFGFTLPEGSGNDGG